MKKSTQEIVRRTRGRDTGGASTTLQVGTVHTGAYYPTLGSGGGGKKPISIDLGNDGFGFTNVDDSNVFFDVNGCALLGEAANDPMPLAA